MYTSSLLSFSFFFLMIRRPPRSMTGFQTCALFFLMIRRPPRSTPLSLHDALPIFVGDAVAGGICRGCGTLARRTEGACDFCGAILAPVRDLVARMARVVADSGGRLDRLRGPAAEDRKSTRLNSSH